MLTVPHYVPGQAVPIVRWHCGEYGPKRQSSLISCSVSQYAVVGVAVTGAGWYLTRLARGPDGPSHEASLIPGHL